MSDKNKELSEDKLKDVSGGTLVFDLGGGEFDVSLQSLESGLYDIGPDGKPIKKEGEENK